jgi:hypothetical protein
VWTAHNLIGKSHRYRRIDRFLRSVISLVADRVVLLNIEAQAPFVAELLPAVRPRVIRKIRHVPIPMAEPDRGPRIARSIAKRELGVVEGRVLVAYLPGAHQEDCSRRFADGGDRFDILLVERSAEVSGIAATRDGWVYSGRPDDETYGRILDACDVVVLSDPRALASLTLHAAVSRRRAVVSPDCPAVAELAQLGGAAIIRGPLTADGVAAALLELRGLLDSDDTTPFEQFEAAHSGTVVAGRLADVYGIRR